MPDTGARVPGADVEMAQPNRAVIALSSIVAGAAAGAAVATLFVWGAWSEWFSFLPARVDLSYVVFAAWGLGAVTAFTLSWRLSPAIDESWRRAAMGVTAAMGALGAGGGAQGIGMYSMMLPDPAISRLLLPAYLAVFLAIGFVALRLGHRHRGSAGS